MPRRHVLAALLAVALAAVLPARGVDSASAAEPSEGRTVVAAMFSSGFCPSCRILNPRLNAVLPEYEGTPLEFVKFDQTFSMIRGGRLRTLAETHRVEQIYDELKGRTGFVALVDPRDQQVIEIVTIRYHEDDIRAAFDRALETVNLREIS